MRFTAYIDALGFAAPGIADFGALGKRLQGGIWAAEPWEPAPGCLAPRQAKRLSPAIRLALLVGEAVGPALGEDAAWVFASSVGEGETLNVILSALCEPDMMIQPLRFQNAVHNAAAGQWSIAAGIKGPMTSIAAYDQTFGAGLLKALLQARLEDRPVGLVLYDAPIPVPLDEKRPLGVPMGAALALSPRQGASSRAVLKVEVTTGDATEPRSEAAKALSATGNPVAAVLPLYEVIASRMSGSVMIAQHGGAALRCEVECL
ncbi:MAG: beta-ketoacyl synthase chain length factor [Pseudomonadota bacterium]